MSELVDRSISELRAQHDQLAKVVAGLTEAQLSSRSGASEWTVVDVLSHIGSGAEIAHYLLVAAVTGEDSGAPRNQDVWDRWNAMAAFDQAPASVESNARLVELYEGLTQEQRESANVDLGFLPQPIPLAAALGLRLNELTLHSWDARVGVDPTATLGEEAAELLAQHYTQTVAFIMGFVWKPGGTDPARIALGDYTIVIDDAVRLVKGGLEPTARFEGPLEAGIRLLTGRLKPEYTPDGVSVSGNVSLDDLRQVFQGY